MVVAGGFRPRISPKRSRSPRLDQAGHTQRRGSPDDCEEALMQGMMMEYPLTLLPILERANRLFGQKQIVTRSGAQINRSTYAQLYARVQRLAGALATLGVE